MRTHRGGPEELPSPLPRAKVPRPLLRAGPAPHTTVWSHDGTGAEHTRPELGAATPLGRAPGAHGEQDALLRPSRELQAEPTRKMGGRGPVLATGGHAGAPQDQASAACAGSTRVPRRG